MQERRSQQIFLRKKVKSMYTMVVSFVFLVILRSWHRHCSVLLYNVFILLLIDMLTRILVTLKGSRKTGLTFIALSLMLYKKSLLITSPPISPATIISTKRGGYD